MSKKNRQLAISAIIISFFLGFPIFSQYEQIVPEKSVAVDPFENIELEAKSAYVFDIIKEEALFELNPNERLPLASLAKIMTAIIAKESAPDRTVITVSKDAIDNEGDDKLLIGEKWLLSDILDFAMVKSSNDAASAISASLENALTIKFIYLMNKKARELDLSQTYFFNETGLDISENLSGAYGTAFEMAKIMRYALVSHPEIFEATAYENIELRSLNFMEYYISNTNKYVGAMPRIIGSKTGFTDLAGGNLAIVFDAGFSHPIIAVVMGSSIDGRFSDMKKLISAAFERIIQK